MGDPPTTSPLPLDGIRVLECGDTLAAAYAGRLLADLGADVVKVESIDGDPLRRAGPFVGDGQDPETSASFAYFHAGKRSVALDVATADETGALTALARRADVVIRSTRDGADWLTEADLAVVSAANVGLIVADITTWGRGCADHSMLDLIALAAGGLLSVNGTDPVSADSSPLRYRGEFASIHAACDAVLAILGALHARLADGRGQHVDVSAQAATASILATALATYLYTGTMPVRDGNRSVAPWGFYACRDGRVLLQVTEDGQWLALRRILGEPEWAASEVFDQTASRAELHDVLDTMLAGHLLELTVDELLAACHAEGVAAARVQTATDILAWEHLRAREYFTPIGLGGAPGTSVLAPVPPWRMSGVGQSEERTSPRLGRDTATARADWERSLRTDDSPLLVAGAGGDGADAQRHDAQRPDTRRADAAPLAGLRVVDLTWVWAGPMGAMQFAHLGADVIKFESSIKVDVTRRLRPFADDVVGINRSGYFNQYNQGKRSVTVDVKDPRGLDLLKRTIATADLVIDNMRPGAMARMGLPYDELRRLNPRIVAVAMSGFGESGPERDRMAYGSIIDALSGVAASNGPPGGGPTDFPMSLPDPCAGIHAAIAGVAALYRARRTGVGGRVEVSMLEASVSAFPWPVLIEASGNGPVVAQGNRDASMSPHGVFACAGADDHVAIVVRDDAEMRALARAIGRSELAADPRYTTLQARKRHEDELEAILGAWTAALSSGDAVAALRTAGIPVEPVARMADVAASAVLARRGFFSAVAHSEVGERRVPGPPWTASRSPMRATTPAPCLGEHTREVLRDVLALDDAELDALDAAGVLR